MTVLPFSPPAVRRSGSVRRVAAIIGFALLAAMTAHAGVLSADALTRHVEKFNAMEPEAVVNLVPNAAAAEWLGENVPRFECPDAAVEETYWFRWWALRKQLRRDEASGRHVFGEFITRARPVSSALGHHLMEGRWLRDRKYHDDYVLYWFRGKGGQPVDHFHRFSQWVHHALWSRWLVTQDTAALTGLLDDLVADYRVWETTNRRPDGLFWNFDVRDAMEESISGGRTVKNVRPTISVYMYGNATALAAVARLAGREELAREFDAKAAQLRPLVQQTLWNPELKFFGSVTEQLEPIAVREEIGFIPWYFHLPEPGRGYEVAWRQLIDEAGFKAPWGITTAERRHPRFRSHGTGTCEWDGAVWPYATSQTLTALAHVLRDYPQDVVTNRDWLDAFLTYTRSHVYDGLPYIGEYQDETTGAWLKGRDPRSFYYNHSTYADLLITGLVGLRPRADNTVEVAPLLPEGTWDWFCLDRVRYHGRELTVLWDRDGKRYGRGAGLQVLVDGQVVARSDKLGRVTGRLP
ncbi:MAG TPA: glycosyl hydrolase family 65 protein [Lacunisphaera sp.]|nr:glycosyl hydrolase family 65 protein [Lacunisphaera sp.]